MTSFLDSLRLGFTKRSQPGEQGDFLLALKWSAITHGVLLLLLVLKGLVFSTPSPPYVPTLKVDLVDLPDVLKKDMTNPNLAHFNHEIGEILKKSKQDSQQRAKADHHVEIAPKGEMVLHPKVSKSEKKIDHKNLLALQRIKALAKIQNTADEERLDIEAIPVKGNKISPGTDVSGEAKEASEANYYDTLRSRLQENWTLPTWVARQNLSAQVQIYIDARGKVKKITFVKRSDNVQFDDAVKRAIQESEPFPSPPPVLQANLIADGILVGFPL